MPVFAIADLVLALIIAGATALGGGIAGLITLIAEGKRQRFAREVDARRELRELEQEGAVARGAARVLQAELLRSASAMRTALKTDKWWIPDLVTPPRVSAEDRKRLASRLPPDAWVRVVIAEILVDVAITERAHFPSGIPPLDGGSRGHVESYLESVEAAQVALGEHEAGVPLTPGELQGKAGSDPVRS